MVKGWKDLRPGTDYQRLYDSALCRAKSDWLVAARASEELTIDPSPIVAENESDCWEQHPARLLGSRKLSLGLWSQGASTLDPVVISEKEYKERRIRDIHIFLSLLNPGTIERLYAKLVESGLPAGEAKETIRGIHDRGAHQLQEELDTCRVVQFWGLLTGIRFLSPGWSMKSTGWVGLDSRSSR